MNIFVANNINVQCKISNAKSKATRQPQSNLTDKMETNGTKTWILQRPLKT